MDTDWIAIKLHYGDKAFGVRGNFTSDFVGLCEGHVANNLHIANIH